MIHVGILGPEFGPKKPNCITSHDVLEPLKQVLAASREFWLEKITSSDECFLPIEFASKEARGRVLGGTDAIPPLSRYRV